MIELVSKEEVALTGQTLPSDANYRPFRVIVSQVRDIKCTLCNGAIKADTPFVDGIRGNRSSICIPCLQGIINTYIILRKKVNL